MCTYRCISPECNDEIYGKDEVIAQAHSLKRYFPGITFIYFSVSFYTIAFPEMRRFSSNSCRR